MVIGFFPQEQPPGLREHEEQKLLCECGARGFCHLCGWARCTPRMSLQRAQLPSRPQTSCPELDPSLPSRRGAGGECTGHALHSRPLPACWRAHLSRSAERSSSLPGLVGLGRWIQTVLWAADRQADRQRDRESFVSVRNGAKNDSSSRGSLSSVSQSEVCKAERKHYRGSKG